MKKKEMKKNGKDIIPLPVVEVKVEPEKYWIKNGLLVSHVDYPGIKMRVREIKKFSKNVNDGSGGMKEHTFIKGVVCTWLDKEHKYQQGLFHTRELIQWKD